MKPNQSFAKVWQKIDLRNEGLVRDWTKKLDATPQELNEALEAVRPNKTAAAIWLGSADVIRLKVVTKPLNYKGVWWVQ